MRIVILQNEQKKFFFKANYLEFVHELVLADEFEKEIRRIIGWMLLNKHFRGRKHYIVDFIEERGKGGGSLHLPLQRIAILDRSSDSQRVR